MDVKNGMRRDARKSTSEDRLHGARSPFAPWAGAIGAALASVLQQQGLGNALRFDCGIDAPSWGILTGLAALVVIVGGALISQRELRAHEDASNQDSTRRFIASLSLLASVLATAVVLFMTLAAIMVPPCPP